MKRTDVDMFLGKQVLVETEDGEYALGLLSEQDNVAHYAGHNRGIVGEYEVLNESVRTVVSAAQIVGLRRVDV